MEILSSVAKTPEEKIRILLLESYILAWVKGELPDEYGKIYLKMLYDELKKIRENKKS